jgi:hypothetical protein
MRAAAAGAKPRTRAAAMTGQTKEILIDESIGGHGRQIKAGPLAAVMILLGRALSAGIG